MKILILEELLPDDIIELNEQFKYELELDQEEYIRVETEHLQTMGELEWVVTWIDIGYIFRWDNSLESYVLKK